MTQEHKDERLILHFLSEAMTCLAKKDEDEFYAKYSPNPTIVLTVNGVEVPFVKTLRTIYDLMDAEIEQRHKRLLESVKTLSETVDLLDRFSMEFRQHINDKIDPIRFGDEVDHD